MTRLRRRSCGAPRFGARATGAPTGGCGGRFFCGTLVPTAAHSTRWITRGEAGLAWAKTIALAGQSTYVLVRAAPPPPPLASPYLLHAIEETQKALERGKAESEQYLEDVAERLRKEGFTVETEVILGVQPASGILQYVKEHPVDSIAIATHGRVGLPRLVLGSVADKVVRAATVPVLLTRPE